MAAHTVQVGACGDKSLFPLPRQPPCKEHRDPKSPLNCRCLLGAVVLCRASCSPWVCTQVSVRVPREEDLPFLALWCWVCENRSDYRSKRTAPDYFAQMNPSPKLIKGLGLCLLEKDHVSPWPFGDRCALLQGFASLGQPSHAGDPDDSTLLCGEGVRAGECRQPGAFIASLFLLWVT